MVITIKTGKNFDGARVEALFIGEKNEVTVRPLYESPEDAVIGRGLVSCQHIAQLMRKAYDAGVSGEPFTIEQGELQDDDDW